MNPEPLWFIGPYGLRSTSLLLSWIAMAIVFLGVFVVARRATSGVPRGAQNFFELAFDFVNNFINETVDPERGKRMVTLLVSLLLYVLVCNVLGLLPIPNLSEPTADPSITIGLALVVMGSIHINGARFKGFFGHLKHLFATPMAPLNLMEIVLNPLTLALRLFGNIFAGDILLGISLGVVPTAITGLGIVAGIAGVALTLGVLGFNTFVDVIQAYIFMILTLNYVGREMSTSHD